MPYSHIGRERGQQAESTHQANMRYIMIDRSLVPPADFSLRFSLHQRPSFSFRILLARVDSIPPTTISFCSFVKSDLAFARLAHSGGFDLRIQRRVWSQSRAAVHAPLDRTYLTFHSFLPLRQHAYSTNTRKVLLAEWYERLPQIVTLQLAEVPSTENSRG